jgi:peptide deformylase
MNTNSASQHELDHLDGALICDYNAANPPANHEVSS